MVHIITNRFGEVLVPQAQIRSIEPTAAASYRVTTADGREFDNVPEPTIRETVPAEPGRYEVWHNGDCRDASPVLAWRVDLGVFSGRTWSAEAVLAECDPISRHEQKSCIVDLHTRRSISRGDGVWTARLPTSPVSDEVQKHG